NFNPEVQLSPHDIRNPSGSGPNWYIQATGAIDRPVLEAAGVCDKIADTFMEIRHDVSKVDFPARDKQHLMTALREEAASWTARGHAWRNPNAKNVQAQVDSISKHVQAGVDAARHVQRYLVPANDLGL